MAYCNTRTFSTPSGLRCPLPATMELDPAPPQGYELFCCDDDAMFCVAHFPFQALETTGLAYPCLNEKQFGDLYMLRQGLSQRFSEDGCGNVRVAYTQSGNGGEELFVYQACIKGADAFWLVKFIGLSYLQYRLEPLFEELTAGIATP